MVDQPNCSSKIGKEVAIQGYLSVFEIVTFCKEYHANTTEYKWRSGLWADWILIRSCKGNFIRLTRRQYSPLVLHVRFPFIFISSQNSKCLFD